MHKIKQVPEDFKVDEVEIIHLGEGIYSYFRLTKKGYNTLEVVKMISEFLRMPLKDIGFAGSKDKNAVTSQAISIKNCNPGRMKSFVREGISLEFLGAGKDPISLGDLKGNMFEIVVRNIKEKPRGKKFFVNYFGEQRFSSNNKEIGKAIIKKDFKRAAELSGHRSADSYLKSRPNDHIGALATIPLKLRMMYVHAYQSYIWNKTSSEYVKIKGEINEAKEIPIVGFGTEYEDKDVEKIIRGILKEEGVSEREFIISSMKELSQEGDMRRLYVEIERLDIGELEDDELNEGMKKCLVKFFLKKGCYATEAIKKLMD